MVPTTLQELGFVCMCVCVCPRISALKDIEVG